MDSEQLETLVTAAIPSGIVDQALIPKIRTASKIEATNTSVSGLLRTYKRRLKHTGGDESLLTMTHELIEFLNKCQRDELSMIYISAPNGYYTFLLADPETSEILHWMRMFGNRKLMSE